MHSMSVLQMPCIPCLHCRCYAFHVCIADVVHSMSLLYMLSIPMIQISWSWIQFIYIYSTSLFYPINMISVFTNTTVFDSIQDSKLCEMKIILSKKWLQCQQLLSVTKCDWSLDHEILYIVQNKDALWHRPNEGNGKCTPIVMDYRTL